MFELDYFVISLSLSVIPFQRIRMSDILERPPVQDDLFVFVRFGLEVVKEIVEAEEGALKKVDPNVSSFALGSSLLFVYYLL